MNKHNNLNLQCPVCQMMVNKSTFVLEYLQRTYAFCSRQCQERFQSNPHLYIGTPGHPAPKQHGHEIIKKRIVKLYEPLSENQSAVIVTDLGNMMGIKDIRVELDQIYISYNLLEITVEQIEATVEKTGEKLGNGLAEKLKRAFIHYLEESELDNLESTGQTHRH